MNEQKKSIEELKEIAEMARKKLDDPIIKEVPSSCIKECLELLYNNNCLSKNDFKFLKNLKNKDSISKAIKTIASPGIGKLVLGFSDKESTISNITTKIKTQIINIIESNEYYKLKENAITNNINYTLPKSKKLIDVETLDLFTKKGTVKVGNVEYEISDFDYVSKFVRNSTSKLFAFAIMNLKQKTNTSEFTLTEYANFLNKSDKKEVALKLKGNTGIVSQKLKEKNLTDEQKKQLKKGAVVGDLDILNMITNIRYVNNKNDIQTVTTIVHSYEYNRGKIKIEFHPNFAETFNQNYYMLIPKKLATISDNKYPHAWVLGYYIFEQARINRTCNFELLIESCLDRTTLPTYKNVTTTNRNYQTRIIEPFDKTIDTISETIKDLTIEYKNNYDSINKFLKGKIKIIITNSNIQCDYNELAKKRKTKNIDKNKELKSDRKKKAIQLKNDGKTAMEISKILGLTTKTIQNYLK